MGIVSSEIRGSDSGPARRYYTLNPKGFQLLSEFIRRNILVLGSPAVRSRIVDIIGNDLREGLK